MYVWLACVHKLFSELRKASERFVDELSELASGKSSSTGLHAVPVEGVVEGLGGIVEEALVIAVRLAEDGNHIGVLEICARNH